MLKVYRPNKKFKRRVRLNKAVKKIVALGKDLSGATQSYVVYRGRRSSSPALRPLEKATRRLHRAQMTFSSVYMNEHDRSNEKKKNGWFRDLSRNVRRAGKRSIKKLRPAD